MNVKKLIAELSKMPQDADVSHLWDGASRTNIELVWLSKGGYVVTSDWDMVAYHDEDRPLDAPSEKENPHWRSEESPTKRPPDAGDSSQ